MRRDADGKIAYDYVVEALQAEDARNAALNMATVLSAEEVQREMYNDPYGDK